jgi:hypothetical protein
MEEILKTQLFPTKKKITEPDNKERVATSIKFDKSEHNFGTIKFGESRDLTIEFTNTGKEEFKIDFVQGGCTCTIPQDWSRKPIAAGKKGFVKIKFDSNFADVKKGYSSAIEIYGNVKNDMELFFLVADIVK